MQATRKSNSTQPLHSITCRAHCAYTGAVVGNFVAEGRIATQRKANSEHDRTADEGTPAC